MACMPARGFTTLEAVVALSLLVTALASLGQAVSAAARAANRAGARSTAVMLAVDKMEQLRAEPVVVPSPRDALDRDAAGYSDAPSAYVRRWAIVPLTGTSDAFVVVVRVIAKSGGEARLATVRAQRGY